MSSHYQNFAYIVARERETTRNDRTTLTTTLSKPRSALLFSREEEDIKSLLFLFLCRFFRGFSLVEKRRLEKKKKKKKREREK